MVLLLTVSLYHTDKNCHHEVYRRPTENQKHFGGGGLEDTTDEFQITAWALAIFGCDDGVTGGSGKYLYKAAMLFGDLFFQPFYIWPFNFRPLDSQSYDRRAHGSFRGYGTIRDSYRLYAKYCIRSTATFSSCQYNKVLI